jgi:hypothetical protein
MPILWDEHEDSKPKPLSKEYIEDRNWAYEHTGEFVEKYPNQWVAVVNKEVVCVGKSLAEVQKVARQKAGDRPPFYYFARRVFRYVGSAKVRHDN